jgi:hypothetical protein
VHVLAGLRWRCWPRRWPGRTSALTSPRAIARSAILWPAAMGFSRAARAIRQNDHFVLGQRHARHGNVVVDVQLDETPEARGGQSTWKTHAMAKPSARRARGCPAGAGRGCRGSTSGGSRRRRRWPPCRRRSRCRGTPSSRTAGSPARAGRCCSCGCWTAARRASTAGQTAACRRLYSAMRSGAMPMTMPMRCIACSLFSCWPARHAGGLRQPGHMQPREVDDRLQAARLLERVVLGDVGQAVCEERIKQPEAQCAQVGASLFTLAKRVEHGQHFLLPRLLDRVSKRRLLHGLQHGHVHGVPARQPLLGEQCVAQVEQEQLEPLMAGEVVGDDDVGMAARQLQAGLRLDGPQRVRLGHGAHRLKGFGDDAVHQRICPDRLGLQPVGEGRRALPLVRQGHDEAAQDFAVARHQFARQQRQLRMRLRAANGRAAARAALPGMMRGRRQSRQAALHRLAASAPSRCRRCLKRSPAPARVRAPAPWPSRPRQEGFTHRPASLARFNGLPARQPAHDDVKAFGASQRLRAHRAGRAARCSGPP